MLLVNTNMPVNDTPLESTSSSHVNGVRRVNPRGLQKLLDDGRFVIMFYSDHCRWCKELSPKFDAFAALVKQANPDVSDPAYIHVAAMDYDMYKEQIELSNIGVPELHCHMSHAIVFYPTIIFVKQDSSSKYKTARCDARDVPGLLECKQAFFDKAAPRISPMTPLDKEAALVSIQAPRDRAAPRTSPKAPLDDAVPTISTKGIHGVATAGVAGFRPRALLFDNATPRTPNAPLDDAVPTISTKGTDGVATAGVAGFRPWTLPFNNATIKRAQRADNPDWTSSDPALAAGGFLAGMKNLLGIKSKTTARAPSAKEWVQQCGLTDDNLATLESIIGEDLSWEHVRQFPDISPENWDNLGIGLDVVLAIMDGVPTDSASDAVTRLTGAGGAPDHSAREWVIQCGVARGHVEAMERSIGGELSWKHVREFQTVSSEDWGELGIGHDVIVAIMGGVPTDSASDAVPRLTGAGGAPDKTSRAPSAKEWVLQCGLTTEDVRAIEYGFEEQLSWKHVRKFPTLDPEIWRDMGVGLDVVDAIMDGVPTDPASDAVFK